MRIHILFLFMVCTTVASNAANEIPAFPGAEGKGANTPGGRGGMIYLLLHLPDRFSNRHYNDMFQLDAPFAAAPVQIIPTETALHRVLDQAGASKPKRDEADKRVLGQYRFNAGRLINVPLETGGWPEYESDEILLDTDADGIPDEWEQMYGLSPSDATDSAGDDDEDGYTNVEEFLNETLPTAPPE